MPNARIDDDFLLKTTAFLRSCGIKAPRTAVILGSGLGEFANALLNPVSVPLASVPDYPRSSVAGHAGFVHFGKVSDGAQTSKPALVFQGRIHPYEGGNAESFALNVRLAHALGAKQLLVTNAAGGIRSDLFPGSIMLHTGIMKIPNIFTTNQIQHEIHAGTLVSKEIYNDELGRCVVEAGKALGIGISTGVYCYVPGPSYETPSEVTMMRIIGADAVGMSTYPEIVEATALGLPTVALSLISNQASGLSGQPLSHAEVTTVAGRAGSQLTSLVTATLLNMDRLHQAG